MHYSGQSWMKLYYFSVTLGETKQFLCLIGFYCIKKLTWNYKLIVISLGSRGSVIGKHRNILETLHVIRIVAVISWVRIHMSNFPDVSWIEKNFDFDFIILVAFYKSMQFCWIGILLYYFIVAPLTHIILTYHRVRIHDLSLYVVQTFR